MEASMLNRRNFIKTVTALGMGMVFPAVRRVEGMAGQSSCTDIKPINSAAPIATASKHIEGECDSLIELERCADLLDDLDCIEIVSNCVGLTEFSRSAGEVNLWRAYCPCCEQRTIRSLEVGQERFNCEWCDSTGSAIDCYARIEGLSHHEASLRLEALLNGGILVGRRPEYEHAWELMARTQRFYHELLSEDPAGSDARRILADHGVGASIIKRFMLGYTPIEPADLLSRHLLAAGYNIECLHSVCFPAEDGSRTLVDRYRGGNLLIPVHDSSGRNWGFFQKRLFSDSNNFDTGWSQSLLRVSERRLRRLIVPHPTWPRDFDRYERLLLTRTPWDVIAQQEAGIDNVVYVPEGPMTHDPVTRRTLLALSKTIVCPFDSEGRGPAAAYEWLDAPSREPWAIRIMPVPTKGGIINMLETGGAAAVRTAMDRAIPFHQWVG
jgi:hypothetical protein